MPIEVEVPDVGVVEFPDDYTESQITEALSQSHQPESAAPQAYIPGSLTPPGFESGTMTGTSPGRGIEVSGPGQAEIPPSLADLTELAQREPTPTQALAQALSVSPQTMQNAWDVIKAGPLMMNTEQLGQRDVPPSTGAQIAAGVQNVGAGIAASFTDPLVAGSMGAGAAIPALSPLISGGFALQMGSQIGEQARQAGAASVTGTPFEKTVAYGNLGSTAAFLAGVPGIGHGLVVDFYKGAKPAIQSGVRAVQELMPGGKLLREERIATAAWLQDHLARNQAIKNLSNDPDITRDITKQQQLQQLKDQQREIGLSPAHEKLMSDLMEDAPLPVELVWGKPRKPGQYAGIRRGEKGEPDVIEFHGEEVPQFLEKVAARRRAGALARTADEEFVHSKTSPEDADAAAAAASPIEKWVTQKNYGAKVEGRDLGYEIIRQRIQKMSGGTREAIEASFEDRLDVKALDALSSLVSKWREFRGYRGAREGRAAVDRTLANIEAAKAVRESTRTSPLTPEDLAETTKAIDEPTPADVEKSPFVAEPEDETPAPAPAAPERGLSEVEKGRLRYLEGEIENLQQNRPLRQRKLSAKEAEQEAEDYKNNLESLQQERDQLMQKGVNLGPAAINKYKDQPINEQNGQEFSDALGLRWDGVQDFGIGKKLVAFTFKTGPETGATFYVYEGATGADVLSKANAKRAEFQPAAIRKSQSDFNRDAEKFRAANNLPASFTSDLSKALAGGPTTSEVQKFLTQNPEYEKFRQGPAAIRKRSFKEQQMDKLADLRRAAQEGREAPPIRAPGQPGYGPVSKEERVGATEAGAAPSISAADLEKGAAEHLAGEIKVRPITREKTKQQELADKARAARGEDVGPRVGYDRPSFSKFLDWAQRNMEGVKPAQLRDMWQDRVWSELFKASPERLEEWRKALGLESHYGRSPIAPPPPPEVTFRLEQEFHEGKRAAARVLKEEGRIAGAKGRYRNKLIEAIGMKLIRESVTERPDLSRETITTDDIDFGNTKTQAGPYRELSRDEISDPQVLNRILRDQARASSVDPESATRRLVAVVDKNGNVDLLSTYNDAGVQRVTDPTGPKAKGRPNRELNSSFMRQYRPIATVLLSDPVQGFHQRFESVSEFMDKIGKEALDRSRVGEFPGEGAAEGFQAEGTHGLEGEGGTVMGPQAAAARAAMGISSGAVEAGESIPMTGPEAASIIDHVISEVGKIESSADVDLAIQALKYETNPLVLSGYRKLARAIQDEHPNWDVETLLKKLSDQIYENYQTSKTGDEFISRTLSQAGVKPPVEAPAPPPSPTARELTAPVRRTPIPGAGGPPLRGITAQAAQIAQARRGRAETPSRKPEMLTREQAAYVRKRPFRPANPEIRPQEGPAAINKRRKGDPTPGSVQSVFKYGERVDTLRAIEAVVDGDKPVTYLRDSENFIKDAKYAKSLGLLVDDLGYAYLPTKKGLEAHRKIRELNDAFQRGEKIPNFYEKYGSALGFTKKEISEFVERSERIDAGESLDDLDSEMRRMYPYQDPQQSEFDLGPAAINKKAVMDREDAITGAIVPAPQDMISDVNRPVPRFHQNPIDLMKAMGLERVLGKVWGPRGGKRGVVEDQTLIHAVKRVSGKSYSNVIGYKLQGDVDRLGRPFKQGDDGNVLNVPADQRVSLAPSDLFEEWQRDKNRKDKRIDLTPQQESQFKAMLAIVKDAYSYLDEKNAKLDDYEAEARQGELALGEETIYRLPRVALHKRGSSAAQRIKDQYHGRMGATYRVEQDRLYKTEEEGQKTTIYEPDMVKRVVALVDRVYRSVANADLANEKALGGKTPSERVPILAKEYEKQLRNGTMTQQDILDMSHRPRFEKEGEVEALPGKIYDIEIANKLNKYFGNRSREIMFGDISRDIKSLVLSADLAQYFTQLGPLAITHPFIWKRATLRSVEAIMNPNIMAEYMQNPANFNAAKEMSQFGVSLGHNIEFMSGTNPGELTTRLPEFARQVPQPIIRKAALIGAQAISQTVLRSGRAFGAAFDVSKIELWKSMSKVTSREQWPEMARVIEAMTFSGGAETTGMSPIRAAREQVAFMAASYYRSAFQLTAMMIEKGVAGREARKLLGGYVGGTVLGMTALYLMSGMSWDEIGKRLHPGLKNQKFLTYPIKVGGETIEMGPGGIVRNMISLGTDVAITGGEDIAGIVKGERGFTGVKQWPSLISYQADKNPFAYWLRTKLGPVPSTALDVATGRDVFDNPVNPKDTVAKLTVPYTGQTIYRATQREKVAPAVVEGTASFIGLNTSRSSAAGEIQNLANRFIEKEGLKKETGWDFSRTDEASYSRLRAAVRSDNRKAFNQIYDRLLVGRDEDKIEKAMKHWRSRSFAGSKDNEAKFKASLTAEERQLYEKADEERYDLYLKFKQFRDQR